MDVSEAIRSRRSIRRYKAGVKIPKEHFEQILEAAMMAPSGCNMRPWEFAVVEDREILSEIMQIHPYANMLHTASAAIIVCGFPQEESSPAAGLWPQDCGASAAYILLEAKGLGYGTCWCGVYPNEDRVEALKNIVDTEGIPFCIIAIGVPNEDPAPRGKYDPKKVKFM